MTLKVIDMLPGSGKTTHMIKWLSMINREQHYIYITPYLNEVDKIEGRLNYNAIKFESDMTGSPKEQYHKCRDTIHLMIRHRNIVCTHAVFLMLVKMRQFWKLLEKKDYILIIDEELPLQQDYHFSGCTMSDVKYFLLQPVGENEPCLKINDNGQLEWMSHKRNASAGMFKKFARDVKTSCLVMDKNWIKWQVPIDKFDLFKDVFIMTYRFKWSLFRLVWGDDWEYWHFENDSLVAGEWQIPKEMARYIAIHLNPAQSGHYERVSRNGHYPFSLGWYKDVSDDELRDVIRQLKTWERRGAFGGRIDKSKLLWTVFKEYREKIERLDDDPKESFRPKRTDCFVPLNMRASNEYLDKTAVVYLVDRHLGGTSEVSRDEWSLSELLQLVFRTALRDQNSGQFVYIWVPSERMWNLLNDWWGEMWRIGTEGGMDPITKEEVDREKARAVR